jgi:nucleoid-associated protein YgaU
MWVAMSRASAVGILVATLATGALGGWFLRGTGGGSDPKDAKPAALAALPPRVSPPAPSVGREPVPREAPPREAPPPPPPRAKPAVEATGGVTSSPTPGNWFRLGGNDTLSEIAKRAYGTTKRTPEIERANPALDPTKLRPGTLVYIPAAAETAPPAPPPPPSAPDKSPAKPAAGTPASKTAPAPK